MIGELILYLFHARTSAHVFHLQTRSYAAHKALEEFYEEIVDLADELAEVYQGEYGLIKFDPAASDATLPKDALTMLDDLREAVDDCAKKCFHEEDTHLDNICDEIRALIARTQYKLRFLA